jgi:hypothetical protein
MRLAATISRYLLGLIFTVFGLNGFFHFIPGQPQLSPLAMQYFGALVASHYMVPVFLLQVVCGVMFLANRRVPLALTLIAPVIVNVLLFHALMDPKGIVPGTIAAICWCILFSQHRAAFAGILGPDAPRPSR